MVQVSLTFWVGVLGSVQSAVLTWNAPDDAELPLSVELSLVLGVLLEPHAASSSVAAARPAIGSASRRPGLRWAIGILPLVRVGTSGSDD